MAKTTSQIVKENREKQKVVDQLVAAAREIDSQAAKARTTKATTPDNYSAAAETNPATRVQKAREYEAHGAGLDIPNQSQIRADAAKQNLERYLQSDERKKWLQKAQADLQAQALLTGSADGRLKVKTDKREDALKAEISYWENMAKAERNAEKTRSNMDIINAMDENERAAFDKYVRGSTYVNPQDIEAYKQLKAKYGDELDRLKESYEWDKNQKRAENVQAKTEGMTQTTGGKVLHSIAAIPASIGGGVTGTAARIDEAINRTGQYETLSPYTLGDIPNVYAQTVQNKTIEGITQGEGVNLDDGISARELGALGYQGVMGAAETGGRLLATGGNPAAALGLAAMKSFSGTVQQASAQGASPEEALALATLNAGIEVATERIPMDNLFKIAQSGAKPAAQVIKSILKQSGIEILEEEAALIGTTLAEAAILRDKSEYQQSIGEMVAGGMSYEDAKAQADRNLLEEAKQTAIITGFSGMFSAGGAEAYNAMTGGRTGSTPTATPTQTAETQTQTEQAEAQAQTQENAEQPVQEAQEQAQAVQEAPAQVQPEQRNTVDVLTETITGRPAADSQTSTQQVDTQEQSAEGGQVEGNDRAGTPEQNFTGKPAYNATLSEDNAQADRRDDVRPMELPKQDINGNNISAVTGDVYASRNTPGDLAEAMEEPVARGDFGYITITNDQATERARQTIVTEGSWETARERFRTDVENGNAGAELTARGALILNHYGEVYEQVKASGDTEAAAQAKRDWLQALSYVQKLGTNTAQGLQAFRIIRNLMPQDKLIMMQMATNDLAREMKIPGGLEIDQSLIQEYENAQTDEQRDEVVTKIQKNVAQQIPSTMLDMWNALRYTNMLGNLKTIVRNTIGNAVNMEVYRAKDMTAAAVEAFIDKKGGKIDRTKTAFVNKQLKQDCGEYYDMVKEAVSSGAKFNESMSSADQYTQGILENRRVFDTNINLLKPVAAGMEVYRKATDWAMNNKYFGDAAFGKAAFTHAMAGYLQANGVKPGTDLKTVDQALMDKAMAYAVQEAQEATFHDNSALARVMGRLKKNTGIVGEGIAPFTKTPANILTRAEEFSPLGIVNTAVMAAQKAAGDTNLANKAGKLGDFARAGQEITNADIVNGFAKAFTGTQIFAIGAALYSLGFLTGGPDYDEDKATFDKENGVQNYALRIGGINITMDWLTPIAMPMFMGAELMKIMRDKDVTFADMEQLFTSIANPMLQMSMLQGINDSLDNIQNAENNLGQFLLNSSVSYLTQGLTNTALRQIEKSTEGTRQTTYIDKDSQTPKWLQYQLGRASQKVPGWEYQQTEYINARGETEKQPTGALGLVYNMLSPAYVKKERFDNVTDELYRMNEAGAEGNVFFRTPDTTVTYTDKTGEKHADYNMTPEQADVYKRQAGQLDARITEDLINSEGYENLTEEQKAKARADIRSYALKTAEIAAIGESHTGYSEAWMDKLTGGKEAREILQRTVKSDIANAVEAMSTAWEKGYNEKERGEKLQEAYDAYASLPAIDRQRVKNQATGEAARYIDARNSGISHKKYMDTAKLLDGIVPEPGKKEARAVQKAETVAASRTLTEAEKEFLIKQQVSDSQAENIDELQDLSQTNKELQKIGGVTMEMYAELYRDHEDYTKGDGKKKRTYKYWAKKYGISENTAKALYEVFS